MSFLEALNYWGVVVLVFGVLMALGLWASDKKKELELEEEVKEDVC